MHQHISRAAAEQTQSIVVAFEVAALFAAVVIMAAIWYISTRDSRRRKAEKIKQSQG